MKIRDVPLSLEKPFLQRHSRITKGISSKTSSSFQKELRLSQKKQLIQKLKSLFAQIDESGERLVKLRTLETLSQYKELIKNFLKEVVENLYILKEEIHFDPKGRHKVLVLIKTINKTLEDLVKMFLNKETSNFKLLEKIGEIRGMLIDLYS